MPIMLIHSRWTRTPSIPEGHSSGASEENDEHEHDYGETDAGNNDNYNDMYFENEEDDYHFAEDYD